MERTPCPACGAPNLPTDYVCLSCGASLAPPAASPRPPVLPPPRRRGRWLLGAGLALLVAMLLFPAIFYLLFWPLVFVAGGWLWDRNDQIKERAWVKRVEEAGGDKIALQLELARHHRPDRIVQACPHRAPVHVRGFDSRLDDKGADSKKT